MKKDARVGILFSIGMCNQYLLYDGRRLGNLFYGVISFVRGVSWPAQRPVSPSVL